MKAYNFEVYTCHPSTGESGWEIEFPDVVAESKKEAKLLLKRWPLFDCIILFNHETETEKEKGIYINETKIKMNLTDQQVFDRMQSTIDKMKELYLAQTENFDFSKYVSKWKIDEETGAECLTVCCIAGWYPTWFPISDHGLRIAHISNISYEGPELVVDKSNDPVYGRTGYGHDVIGQLGIYHGVRSVIIDSLFYPTDTEVLFDEYEAEFGTVEDEKEAEIIRMVLEQPSDPSLINMIYHWEKVLYAMKTGKIQWIK